VRHAVNQLPLRESQALATQISLAIAVWEFENNRLPEAKARCIELIRRYPDDLGALRLYGQIATELDDYQGVVDALLQVIQKQPDDSASILLVAQALIKLNDPRNAMRHLRAIPPQSSDWLAAQLKVATIQSRLRQWGEAESTFHLILLAEKNNEAAKSGLAEALYEQGRLEEALDFVDEWVKQSPNITTPVKLRGMIRAACGNTTFARQDLTRALYLDGKDARSHSLIGHTYYLEKNLGAALEALNTALQLSPDNPDYRYERSLVLLEMGRFREGWQDYECRWKVFSSLRRFPQIPIWLGEESITGKTILVHYEQGLGDQIQFVRYIEPLNAFGATVILLTTPSLGRLFSNLAGVSEVRTEGQELPPFDFHCPMLSLPFALRNLSPEIPDRVPYLSVDETLVHKWSKRLGPRKSPRIGIVWSGGIRAYRAPYTRIIARRDIPLADFNIFGGLELEFIGLQKGTFASSEEFELGDSALDPLKILHLGDELSDFADTAAVIKNLDLVISVDTAVAHLAGALNIPVWILNRFDHCWRWGQGRTDSLWYPSAHLYRQTTFNNWYPVLAKVREDLIEFARRLQIKASKITPESCSELLSEPGAATQCYLLGNEVHHPQTEQIIQDIFYSLGRRCSINHAETVETVAAIQAGLGVSIRESLIFGPETRPNIQLIEGLLEFIENQDNLEWDIIFPEVQLRSIEVAKSLVSFSETLNQANELNLLNLAEFDFIHGQMFMISKIGISKLVPLLLRTKETPTQQHRLETAVREGLVTAFALFPFLESSSEPNSLANSSVPEESRALYRQIYRPDSSPKK